MANFYFAYGSNLDGAQMLRRCPQARLVGPAYLPHHRLVFAGYSRRWDGAVASLESKRGGKVEGLLYLLSKSDLVSLDRFEGCPLAYRRVRKVVGSSYGWLKVEVYAQPVVARELPSRAYYDVIRRAYVKHGFDLKALKLAVG